jgi:hypothetical protein
MNRIVIDTETANTIEEPLAYDIGCAVVDDDFNVIKSESYAVAEIFLDKELMSTAYFADKIPQYWEEIKSGDRKLARLSTIFKSLKADCLAYDVSKIYAHNARFDDLSLKLTTRFISGSKFRYFFPYGITVCDTLRMSREIFGKDDDYAEFCEKNGYYTSRKQKKMTAEILYRFLSGQKEFEEEHKGLADVLIEKEILKECIKRGATKEELFPRCEE